MPPATTTLTRKQRWDAFRNDTMELERNEDSSELLDTIEGTLPFSRDVTEDGNKSTLRRISRYTDQEEIDDIVM